MQKKLLYGLFLAMFFSIGYGQNLWNKVSGEKLIQMNKMERASMPRKYELFSLDFEAFKSQLQSAPLDISGINSNTIIPFPDASGKLMNYQIYEAPVMEPELAAKFPNIKSYVGKGVEDPSAAIRFSVTLFGLHSMSLSGNAGIFYTDTYTKDLKNYIVYRKSDVMPSSAFRCDVTESTFGLDNPLDFTPNTQKASDGKFRTFRLAMACTIEYAAFHVNAAGLSSGTLAQKKAAVLAAMNVTMTRVNGIYERDFSLRMNLIGTNDQIIFIDSDNFTNDSSSALINESQTQITNIIGTANFDIGHTVSTGGGGLAGPSPCSASYKAKGITGLSSPVGDPYDVDYVCHEMGHQFGAMHTFNGSNGGCAGNRNDATAVEPGSGSTIMSYSGLCTGQNVSYYSDTQFHAVSIAQVAATINSTATCAATINNNNAAPIANAGADYTIPYGTAFILKGSATDANSGDALTYCWEQTDTQISTQPPLQTNVDGPNFKSVPISASSNRYMPSFQDVLQGNLAPIWEVVPNVARTMNFALTVRDNGSPNGSQNGRDNMVVTFANVGPFSITAPSVENTSWTQGSTQTITWNVAGTTANGINTANVNILFSSDNGVTFSTLVANTPNDGSQTITVPNVSAPYCRIMIEPVGNIYYALSKNISIGYTVTTTTTCKDYTKTFSPPTAVPLGWTAYNIPSVTDDFTISDVNFKVVSTGVTNQLSFAVMKPGTNTVDTIVFDGPTSGCGSSSANLDAVFDDEGVLFNCAAPATGASYKPKVVLSDFDGMNSMGQWRLALKSTSGGNTISSVVLTLCHTDTVVVLSSQNFDFQDFDLYPNPNKGSFTIKFTSTSSENIKINVHDMRGRAVYEKSFSNTGAFNQNINLDRVESGIYLVSITDGAKKTMKRIVVE